MKKIILPLMLMIFLLTGCGGGDTLNSEGTENKKLLTIGIDDEYAPMGFHDKNGEIVGFDVDLAKETAKRLGVEVKFQPIDWNNKENELNSERIDLIWSGLNITSERKANMLFSKPYMDNRQILLTKIDNDFNINSEYDLANKIVGTQSGSHAEAYVIQNDSLRNILKEFKTYPTFKDAFVALGNGEIELLIVDELVGRYEINRLPDKFKVLEVTVGPVTEIGIGFKKDNIKLRDRVQKAFNEIIKDGTARKISEKWFQADLIKSKR